MALFLFSSPLILDAVTNGAAGQREEGGGRTKAAGSGPLPRRCQSADVSAHSGAGVYPGGKVFVPHFKSAPLQKHSSPKQAFYNLLFFRFGAKQWHNGKLILNSHNLF